MFRFWKKSARPAPRPEWLELDLPDEIRAPEEVARRALTLSAVVRLTLDEPKEPILAWLEENGLTAELTPSEVQFIAASPPTEQQLFEASWLAERLVVLCWALNIIAEMPPADRDCSTADFLKLLPPSTDVAPAQFIAAAKLRPDDALMEMADVIMEMHGNTRSFLSPRHTGVGPIIPDVIWERHRAINWVIGYMGAPWDEVPTDT